MPQFGILKTIKPYHFVERTFCFTFRDLWTNGFDEEIDSHGLRTTYGNHLVKIVLAQLACLS